MAMILRYTKTTIQFATQCDILELNREYSIACHSKMKEFKQQILTLAWKAISLNSSGR